MDRVMANNGGSGHTNRHKVGHRVPPLLETGRPGSSSLRRAAGFHHKTLSDRIPQSTPSRRRMCDCGEWGWSVERQNRFGVAAA